MLRRFPNDAESIELARVVVTVLSGVGEEPLKFTKLQDWLGESRSRTKLAIGLAEREGWIVDTGRGFRLASAGHRILNGRRRA
jgi:hypothetical protein